MNAEFAAGKVALDVVQHLERRRRDLAHQPDDIEPEVRAALEPVRRAYAESELPAHYFEALEREILATLPSLWRAVALPFTASERRAFGVWRGGDPVARLTYLFSGLALGGICVWLPFIPIWEKWFPFAIAIAAYWLPDAQAAWHRRRYARELGAIVLQVEEMQAALESRVTLADLLPPPPLG